jgi:hypothetical protein
VQVVSPDVAIVAPRGFILVYCCVRRSSWGVKRLLLYREASRSRAAPAHYTFGTVGWIM